MRIALALIFGCFLLRGQIPRTPLAGSWVDSQGNRYELAEFDDVVKLTSKSWSFDVGPRSFTADLTLRGIRSGNEFKVVQPTTTGQLVLNGRLAPNGSLRGTVAAPGQDPFEFILVRAPLNQPKASVGKAQRVGVRITRASTELGRWIPVTVGLVGADGNIVTPAEPVFIDLNSNGGTPIPRRVRVTPESPEAPAGIKVDNAEVSLTASTAGLAPVMLNAWGCADTPVAAIRISTRRAEGIANGRDALPLILKFVDGNGAPAHNQRRPKSLDWTVSGAVRKPLADRQGVVTDNAVGPDECVSLQEITSDRPGKASIKARFASLQEEVTLQFDAPLTALAIALALLGGLIGGLASAAQNYKSAARWKARRWAASLFTAETGAVALFLGWHYGLVSNLAMVPGGAGFAFLAGLIGGWAGGRVLATFSDSIAPPEKSRAAGAA